jgi:hypothetical protein
VSDATAAAALSRGAHRHSRAAGRRDHDARLPLHSASVATRDRSPLVRAVAAHSQRGDLRVRGHLASHAGNVLVVANHISSLDIFVLNAVGPVRFVAKSELARWPAVG